MITIKLPQDDELYVLMRYMCRIDILNISMH